MHANDLGFSQIDDFSWLRADRPDITYRLLHTLDELTPVEAIQRDVFGATDLDIYAAGQLLTFSEVGGHVLSAWLGDQLAGALIGIGGLISGKPHLLSDWMGVYPDFRSHGLGADLKRLQFIVSLEAGYEEIFWTVDPLRAANARLNFGKLGARSNQYEENRYGKAYGEALYGGLPSDRLLVNWPITDPIVQRHLRASPQPLTGTDVASLADFTPGLDAPSALVRIPNDIDKTLAADREAALAWRLALRSTLPVAFASGYSVTGFVGNLRPDQGESALILTRESS